MTETLPLDELLVQIVAQIERARAYARAAGLVLGPVEVELRGDVRTEVTGTVFATEGDGRIRARVVEGPRAIALPLAPDLLGMTRAAATRAARKAGVALTELAVPGAPTARGRVVWQRPAASEAVGGGRMEVGVGA